MGATYVGLTRVWFITFWVVFPLIGAAVGWWVPEIADQLRKLPWVPFEGPLRLAGDWGGVATAALGAAAGGFLAHAAKRDSLEVTVDDQQVRWCIHGTTRIFLREHVGWAGMEGKHLVIHAADGRELAREKPEGDAERAFRDHGYAWRD